MDLINKTDVLNEIWKIRQRIQMMDNTQTADKIMTGLYHAEKAVENSPTFKTKSLDEFDDYMRKLESLGIISGWNKFMGTVEGKQNGWSD